MPLTDFWFSSLTNRIWAIIIPSTIDISRRKTYFGAMPKVKKSPKKFRLRFKNKRLLEAALSHPSYRNENPKKGKLEDFDRLEFFGDTILNFVICQKLYKLFPEADEGMLSRLRSILVSRKVLGRISRDIRLIGSLQVGRSLKAQKDFLKAKVSADALESVIAALYFDQGLERTQRFILKHFKPYLDAKKLFRLDPNPKSMLQELVQKHWKKLPTYHSKPSKEGFKTVVSINRKLKYSASAKNRRESEEKAARLLIRGIRQELVGRSNKKSSGKKLRKTF